MRKLAAALALVFMISLSGATTIASEQVHVDLEDSYVETRIDVDELTTEKFTYITSYEVSNVRAVSSGNRLDCSTNNLAVGSEILCDPPRQSNFTVKLSFQGSGFVTEQGETRIFRYSQSIYRPTDNYSLRVSLPEGSGILSERNLSTPVISPGSGKVSSNGRRIFVTWKQEPQLGETLRFQVVYERFSRRTSYLRYGALGLGAVLMAVLVFMGYRYWNREDIESVYEDVPEDGVEVLEILKDNGGSMLQKDVVKETSYSKAKVSGIVSDLVDEEIITKEKEGRSNMLSISRKYRS